MGPPSLNGGNDNLQRPFDIIILGASMGPPSLNGVNQSNDPDKHVAP